MDDETCGHLMPRPGRTRAAKGCVAIGACNPKSHYGSAWDEHCDACGQFRVVNSCGADRETGPWMYPAFLAVTSPIDVELARDCAVFFQHMFGVQAITPRYVAGLVTCAAWERARHNERWQEHRDPELPHTALIYERPGLEGELDDYIQAWRDWSNRPPR